MVDNGELLPLGPKSRENCPRIRKWTIQRWRTFFTIPFHAQLGHAKQWSLLSGLCGFKEATVKSYYSKVYPSGQTRVDAPKEQVVLGKTDWTQQEIDLLVSAVEQGEYKQVIADKLHRTIGACSSKYAQIQTGYIPTPAKPRLPRFQEIYKGRKQQEKKTYKYRQQQTTKARQKKQLKQHNDRLSVRICELASAGVPAERIAVAIPCPIAVVQSVLEQQHGL